MQRVWWQTQFKALYESARPSGPWKLSWHFLLDCQHRWAKVEGRDNISSTTPPTPSIPQMGYRILSRKVFQECSKLIKGSVANRAPLVEANLSPVPLEKNIIPKFGPMTTWMYFITIYNQNFRDGSLMKNKQRVKNVLRWGLLDYVISS